jgi:acetyltransferase-like isoleucine patch superfamily enzyme
MISKKLKKRVGRLLLSMPVTMNIRVVLLRFSGYKVGKSCTIGSHFTISDRAIDIDNIIIGDRVNIGSNVSLITSSAPNTSVLNRIYKLKYEKIIIGNDCWIGTGVIILPGITIGDCSIVGAGVVVEKDIPKYTVVKHSNPEYIKLHDSLINKLSNRQDHSSVNA